MDLDVKELESAIEGILFASGEPVQIDRICTALDLDRPTAERILQKLMDYYAYERRGIRLLRMEDSWQLCSSPDYADVIRKAFEIRKPAKLSQPALEVLTIIAYYQPTTRAYVDQIRGVDSAYTVGLLLNRGLIEEAGRLQVPGRPHLYHHEEVPPGLPPHQPGRPPRDAGPGRGRPAPPGGGRRPHRPGEPPDGTPAQRPAGGGDGRLTPV